MTIIKPFEEKDWKSTWNIIEPVFRAGETYVFSPDISEKETYNVWIEKPLEAFVAVDSNNTVMGTYYLKENQPGLGNHVCNCGYIVGNNFGGRGIGRELCRHSQREAIVRGFRAMQYNMVVATNEIAINLWEKEGFETVGTLRKAFRHARFGLIDAYVMYKLLNIE